MLVDALVFIKQEVEDNNKYCIDSGNINLTIVNNAKHCLLENITTNERPYVSFLSISKINNSHL